MVNLNRHRVVTLTEYYTLYLEAGKIQQIHEKSLFKRENQKWVYVSGEHL